MPKKSQAKKKVVKKPVKRKIVRKPQMSVDEKTKMNEMLKTMLARGPDPCGTTLLGAGRIEAERKLTDKINDVHNLQL